ncbi:DUF2726 domain-containing protein [Brachyspira sp.]|uniref:DUF2726 domain-containing protein n=1 Tax=Brachyspira sp. TaxID=1977261 RepID=UPI00260C8E01|nr:DUF2726 domain-containing protein [Brachyspira sp.]
MTEIIIAMAIVSAIILYLILFYKIKKTPESSKEEYNNEIHDYNNNISDENEDEYKLNAITEQRLKYMESGSIKTKKIMNIEEMKIFYSMVKVFDNYNINPQVSFRAFLKGEENTASWKTFRDFYCDFLITYKNGSRMNEPAAVIEYHGGGHFGDTDKKRKRVSDNDMIREKLFNKIGLKYFILKDLDIKMKSGLIDERQLNACLKNINDILTKQN